MDPSTSVSSDHDLQSELERLSAQSGWGSARLEEFVGRPQGLFSKESFASVLAEQRAKMLNEIKEYGANELLNTGTERLLEYFYEKYSIDVPALDEGKRSVGHYEAEINVGDRLLSGPPKQVSGFRYRVIVPFAGDPRVFNSRPSAMKTSQPPRASLTRDALVFFYDQIDVDEDALKASHSQDLLAVKQYLGWLAAEADAFNSEIRPYCEEQIQIRRARLLKAHGAAVSLGIRLEKS